MITKGFQTAFIIIPKTEVEIANYQHWLVTYELSKTNVYLLEINFINDYLRQIAVWESTKRRKVTHMMTNNTAADNIIIKV